MAQMDVEDKDAEIEAIQAELTTRVAACDTFAIKVIFFPFNIFDSKYPLIFLTANNNNYTSSSNHNNK